MSLLDRISNALDDIVSIDLRSLGFFRIFLGAIVISDLIVRAFYLKAHYSDYGVLPRKVLMDCCSKSFHISIHMLSGEVWVQAVIFILAGICAFLFMVGYRSRLMAFLCLIFAVGLQMRNPIVLNSGDNLYRLMLFFSIFLPVGARFSVDNLLDRHPDRNVLSNKYSSIATVGFLIQVILIYLITGIHKVPGAEWQNGTAIYYVMNAELFSSPLGQVLLDFPNLMKMMTHVTLWVELYGWILIFIPFFFQYFRLAGVAIFIALHIGFMFTMRLGHFPWIDMAAWLPIIPAIVWDKFEWKRIRALCSAVGDRVKNAVDYLKEKEWLHMRHYRYAPNIVLTVIIAAYIPLIIAWNLQALEDDVYKLKIPPKIQRFAQYPAVWQSWRMFAPTPIKNDGWLVMPAYLANGDQIDLITGNNPVSKEKPADAFDSMINQRWRKYFRNVMTNNKYKDHWLYVARYFARDWNDKYKGTEKELQALSIIFMQERTPPPGQPVGPPVEKNKYNYWTNTRYKHYFDKTEKEEPKKEVPVNNPIKLDGKTKPDGTVDKDPTPKLDGGDKKDQTKAAESDGTL